MAPHSQLQHSCLENPMDRGAWWATVHGVAKSRTRLSDFFHAQLTDGHVEAEVSGKRTVSGTTL